MHALQCITTGWSCGSQHIGAQLLFELPKGILNVTQHTVCPIEGRCHSYSQDGSSVVITALLCCFFFAEIHIEMPDENINCANIDAFYNSRALDGTQIPEMFCVRLNHPGTHPPPLSRVSTGGSGAPSPPDLSTFLIKLIIICFPDHISIPLMRGGKSTIRI